MVYSTDYLANNDDYWRLLLHAILENRLSIYELY